MTDWRGVKFAVVWIALAAFAVASIARLAQAGDLPTACPAAPLGVPMVAGTELVCHDAYASLLKPSIREPVLVAYVLTSAHAVTGCGSRQGMQFKVDALAPSGAQGRLVDYAGSGKDLGHLMPNEDGAWDQTVQISTFSFANVSPQDPGLNRQGWSAAEQFTRTWAWQRGGANIWVMPIIPPNAATIGPDKLPVPSAFAKVVYDPQANEVLAFEMPNGPIAKMADLTPWIVSLAKAEQDAGIVLPIPAGAAVATTAWPADLPAWRKAHAAACALK